MLNKDYYFLLPEYSGLSETVRFIEIRDADSVSEIRTGERKSAADLEVNFPIDKQKLADEENLVWDGWASILDYSNNPYSFRYLLINDVTAFLEKTRKKDPRVIDVAMEMAKRNPSNSQIYIGMENPLDYTKLRRPGAWVNKFRQLATSAGMRSVKKHLRRAGFRHIRTYPIIIQEGVSEEIIFQPKYVSCENSFSMKERVKEILLGAQGIKFFASAYCLVASKLHLRTNIEGLIESVCEQIPIDGLEADELQIYQFISLLLPRKIIVTLGDKSRKRFIVVLSRWRLVAARRDREAKNLQEMEKQGLDQLGKFPKYYGTGVWQGMRFHVIEAIEGITVDTYLPQIAGITTQALDYLARLRKKTGFEVTVDENNIGEIAGWIFVEGRDKHSEIQEIMKLADDIEKKITDSLLGRTIRLSRMHGDYKIENILVDRKTANITGIIDWEHSRAKGLPALDLWYLFLYNRQIESNEDMYDVIENTCFTGSLNDYELSEFEKLNSEMRYPDVVDRTMKSLFVLHHIMCRMTHDYSKPEIRKRIQQILEQVLHDLENNSDIEKRKEAV